MYVQEASSGAAASLISLEELDRRIGALEQGLHQQLRLLSDELKIRIECPLKEGELRYLAPLLDHTALLIRESAQLQTSRQALMHPRPG